QELLGKHDLYPCDQIARAAMRSGHTLAREAEGLAVLCFWRDRQEQALPIWRWHRRLAAQDRRGQGHLHLQPQVVAFAPGDGHRFDAYHKEQIAARPAAGADVALTGNGDSRAVVRAGWNLHFEPARAQHSAGPTADGAGAAPRDAPGAVAGGAAL